MLHHVLQAAKGDESMEEEDNTGGAIPTKTEGETSEKPGESSTSHMTSTGITLRHEDKTSAGDNLEFMRSKLVWEMGDDGKERVCDADGNG
jgi:protein arginine N-methyltransferase 2